MAADATPYARPIRGDLRLTQAHRVTTGDAQPTEKGMAQEPQQSAGKTRSLQ